MNEFMYLFNVIFFILMYFLSFHLVLNSDDWFLVWLGLEMNMIMFIVLIYNQYDMGSSESCLSYFFIQSLGSGIFMSLFYVNVFSMKSLLSVMMSYKLGAGPFFFWFPSLCIGISWMSCFVLLTFQKVIPLMLMNVFIGDILFLIVIMSLLIGILGSFNQVSLKELLAYSSVFHLGWIILCNLVDDLVWLVYMFIYMFMLCPLIFFFYYYNIFFISEVLSIKAKGIFVFLMLSMAGMPPLLGFFVKWFALYIMFSLSWYMMFILVMSSVVMFYVYFRLLYDVLLAGSTEGIWMMWEYEFGSWSFWVDMLSVMGMFLGGAFIMLMFL